MKTVNSHSTTTKQISLPQYLTEEMKLSEQIGSIINTSSAVSIMTFNLEYPVNHMY